LVIVSLLIGVIAGAYFFDFFTEQPRKTREFAFEGDELWKVLRSNASDESKIIMLNHFINFSETKFHFESQPNDVPEEVYHDVIVAYVKLGDLYQAHNNPESEKYFNAAMKLKGKFVPWIKGFKVESKDDLRRYVSELEQKTKKQTPTSQ
jgi:hypothetical protein